MKCASGSRKARSESVSIDCEHGSDIESMTGFGTGRVEADGMIVVAEVKSVNARFSDVSCSLPWTSIELESLIEKKVRSRFARGTVRVFISLEGARSASIDTLRLREIAEFFGKVTRELGISAPLRLADLVIIPEFTTILTTPGLPGDSIVLDAVDNALDSLSVMRIREGKTMIAALKELFAGMRSVTNRAAGYSKGNPAEFKKLLRARLDELVADIRVDESRLEQEITIYADRIDVTEEIARLYSHFDHAAVLIEEGGCTGRKIDFLSQEILREFNTMGVKSNDTRVTQVCLEGKELTSSVKEIARNLQ